ncbi:transglutaminase-like domain-containing protein [Parafannyhessea umbonata]|uniref:Transglutaminase-like superfamily protein n=1 Tax=Parafannyhessea umbonata TaxID=604330 RepID=A0A1H9Q364_9ACTN|nr:transglutaminase-like domain-containing protein [Parafannyhessea umbonata]SER54313.1 Transglutaminase-like superfamily protein [Parafannyhessea umbonata]
MGSARHIASRIARRSSACLAAATCPWHRALLAVLLCCLALLGCGGSSAQGAPFAPAQSIRDAVFVREAAIAQNDGYIDASHTSDGYVSASATSEARLKVQITHGEQSYNYDLPSDGTPTVFPLNMGDGDYVIRIMRNTSENNYVETTSANVSVTLASPFEPFLRPNVYCNYSESSACVAKAREIVSDAQNQGEAAQKICAFIVDNISYDTQKAQSIGNVKGYVPDPDETLATGRGICFDYAALGCAMLRSQGIPAQLVTGYVSPGDIYHAWMMVYVDGSWQTASFTVEQNAWSRVDLTFAAASDATQYVGDGKTYTDRYIY